MSNATILMALKRIGYKRHDPPRLLRLGIQILHDKDCPTSIWNCQPGARPRNAVSAAYNHALYEPRDQEHYKLGTSSRGHRG